MLKYDQVMEVWIWDQISNLKTGVRNHLHKSGVLVQKISEFEKHYLRQSCRGKKNIRFEKKKHTKMLLDEGDTALGSSAIFRGGSTKILA